MAEQLFGSGTDVMRMDSSMRAWFIATWSQTYKNGTLSPDELANARKNLFNAHSGGDLLLDASVKVEVPEGATTGAAGVSTLESTYRWATDLLGVVLNVQLIILKELKYLAKSGKTGTMSGSLPLKGAAKGARSCHGHATLGSVEGLACREVGTGWLSHKRCVHHPRGQLAPVSPRQVLVCNSIIRRQHEGRACKSNLAMYPPVGPGSALFDALLPIVAFYYHNIVNGDDDWNTFPLAHFIPDGEWHKILDADTRIFWLQRGRNEPGTRSAYLRQGLAHKVVGQQHLAQAFERMRLPTKLNISKGVEGYGLSAFCFNSMRPVSDSFGNWSFAIKGMTMEEEFRSITHPDEKIRNPVHSCLRLIGLSLLNPDPRSYELVSTLFRDLVDRYDLELDRDGKLNITAHLEQCKHEKSNTFYHLGFIDNDELYADLLKGKIAFPSYEKVLSLHGFPTHLYATGSTQEKLDAGAPLSPGWL
jgi:hypothetical protein